jgi:hypothetical protein
MCSFAPCRTLIGAFAFMVMTTIADGDVMREAGPSLRDVLTRVADYAAAYGDALSNVLADEEFVQEIVLRNGTLVERRRLESEIAFVKLADAIEWLAFRSVLRVDGVPVADASRQLERVFRDAPRSALAQARAITAESARHNLGPVLRNFNVPTTVLQFVLARHQDRFRFRKISEERVEGGTLWIVEFREQERSTFIRTPQGRPAPAQGRLWIAPDDGRVLRSRLAVEADVRAEIDVEWRFDDRLKLWVPSEMREAYRGSRTVDGSASRQDVRGVARYSNYRRFEVDFRIVR